MNVTQREVRIAGVVHARLLHAALFAGAAQGEGLLLGKIVEEETVNDASDSVRVSVCRVTSIVPVASSHTFYDEKYELTKPLPSNTVGWFKGRQNTYHRVSARESCVHEALRQKFPQLVFALCTTKVSQNPAGTVDVDCCFYDVPRGERPKVIKTVVPNLKAGSYKEYRLHAELNPRSTRHGVGQLIADATAGLVTAQEKQMSAALAALGTAVDEGGSVSSHNTYRLCRLRTMQERIAEARQQLEQAIQRRDILTEKCGTLREQTATKYRDGERRLVEKEAVQRHMLVEEELTATTEHLQLAEQERRVAIDAEVMELFVDMHQRHRAGKMAASARAAAPAPVSRPRQQHPRTLPVPVIEDYVSDPSFWEGRNEPDAAGATETAPSAEAEGAYPCPNHHDPMPSLGRRQSQTMPVDGDPPHFHAEPPAAGDGRVPQDGAAASAPADAQHSACHPPPPAAEEGW